MQIELKSHSLITADLIAMTGIHVGAGKENVEIGGMDNPIIKHPLTDQPYIPGSSIKGKLRSLLEWTLKKIEPNGKVWGEGTGPYPVDDPILRTFGTTRKDWSGGPTRLIVRDAFLDQSWADDVLARGLALVEEKTEVVIDRIQGKAAGNIGPRRTERVPAGAFFKLEMVFKVFDTGDGGKTDRECLNWLLGGLKLLEQDALGGSGSRGYGRVRVQNLKVGDDDIQGRFDALTQLDPKRPPQLVGT